MSEAFCANIQCERNQYEADGVLETIIEPRRGKFIKIGRNEYRNGRTSRRFFLCDTCHAAVDLVVGMAQS